MEDIAMRLKSQGWYVLVHPDNKSLSAVRGRWTLKLDAFGQSRWERI